MPDFGMLPDTRTRPVTRLTGDSTSLTMAVGGSNVPPTTARCPVMGPSAVTVNVCAVMFANVNRPRAVCRRVASAAAQARVAHLVDLAVGGQPARRRDERLASGRWLPLEEQCHERRGRHAV